MERFKLGFLFGVVFLAGPLMTAGVPWPMAIAIGGFGIFPLALAVMYASSLVHGIEPEQRADDLEDFFEVDEEAEQRYRGYLDYKMWMGKILIGASLVGAIAGFIVEWLFPGMPDWGVILVMIAVGAPVGWYIAKRYPPDLQA
jgi:predicted membrane channel-forming protein YqfA (hemolysin III family)